MIVHVGVIGGSGLYKLEGTQTLEEIEVPTPFGLPSDVISVVELGGIRIAFLPRHGTGHRLLPTEVPSRANIWALKSLGVEHILSISAVGSLSEDFQPGEFAVCDQLIDRTRSRENSYFGDGIVAHIGFAEPFCLEMRKVICEALQKHNTSYHGHGTLVTMEGPLFSTRAESELHRSWNAHLIGMTALPEAKLAREAEICYAVVAMVTDFDCWRPNNETVDIEMVLQVMNKNVHTIQRLIPDVAHSLTDRTECSCRNAARNAITTQKELIPYEVKRKLKLFYDKYWN